MKRFLLIPLALCLLGAADSSRRPLGNRFDTTGFVELTEVGGCQYVVGYNISTGGGIAIVHHAACTNPAHAKPQVER